MKLLLVDIARVLLRLALDRAIREALPRIYRALDLKMPDLLVTAKPQRIYNEISATITAITGKPAATSQVEAVIGLYSPVAGALRAIPK